MAKFRIEATRIHWYEVEIEAVDEAAALNEINDWIADDFEEYETNAQWDFDVMEID